MSSPWCTSDVRFFGARDEWIGFPTHTDRELTEWYVVDAVNMTKHQQLRRNNKHLAWRGGLCILHFGMLYTEIVSFTGMRQLKAEWRRRDLLHTPSNFSAKHLWPVCVL